MLGFFSATRQGAMNFTNFGEICLPLDRVVGNIFVCCDSVRIKKSKKSFLLNFEGKYEDSKGSKQKKNWTQLG